MTTQVLVGNVSAREASNLQERSGGMGGEEQNEREGERERKRERGREVERERGRERGRERERERGREGERETSASILQHMLHSPHTIQSLIFM